MSDKTTVFQKKNGQVVVTVPRGLAESMGLIGKKVEWKVESRERLSFSPVGDDE
jgi:hypothetical protein